MPTPKLTLYFTNINKPHSQALVPPALSEFLSPAKCPPPSTHSIQKSPGNVSQELRSQQPYGSFPSCSASFWRCSSLTPKAKWKRLSTSQYRQSSSFPPGTASLGECPRFPLPFPPSAPSSVTALLLNSTIPLGTLAFFGGYNTSPNVLLSLLPGTAATSAELPSNFVVHWFKSYLPTESSVQWCTVFCGED